MCARPTARLQPDNTRDTMNWRHTSALLTAILLYGCQKPATANITTTSGEAENSASSVATDYATANVVSPSAINEVATAEPQNIRSYTQGDDPNLPDPNEYATALATSGSVFTPAAIVQFAQRRSKSYIRKVFGAPDHVDENTDDWLYFDYNKNLRVVDEDAGKRVSIKLIFAPGDKGDEERVIEVRPW